MDVGNGQTYVCLGDAKPGGLLGGSGDLPYEGNALLISSSSSSSSNISSTTSSSSSIVVIIAVTVIVILLVVISSTRTEAVTSIPRRFRTMQLRDLDTALKEVRRLLEQEKRNRQDER